MKTTNFSILLLVLLWKHLYVIQLKVINVNFFLLYKSEKSDEVFNTISEELVIEGNVGDILMKYFEYVIKNQKTICR